MAKIICLKYEFRDNITEPHNKLFSVVAIFTEKLPQKKLKVSFKHLNYVSIWNPLAYNLLRPIQYNKHPSQKGQNVKKKKGSQKALKMGKNGQKSVKNGQKCD